MSDLERSLNQVLEDHRHESGLHVIGGQRRLVSRLKEFFEGEIREKKQQPESGSERPNKTQ
ncbi:MAG TPA: hypothetical protein VN684_05990 [Terriglobales bacterium]|jgi:hypothetical protein|nr:hypothetical protein [Terriglobales bacterium]